MGRVEGLLDLLGGLPRKKRSNSVDGAGCSSLHQLGVCGTQALAVVRRRLVRGGARRFMRVLQRVVVRTQTSTKVLVGRRDAEPMGRTLVLKLLLLRVSERVLGEPLHRPAGVPSLALLLLSRARSIQRLDQVVRLFLVNLSSQSRRSLGKSPNLRVSTKETRGSTVLISCLQTETFVNIVDGEGG